ncbi:MAG: hypothetical protein H6737_19630 [Alphaproteobacteria bacterium]|nr:hypothetical protein [Alphaproteobacteria bacterium]
MFAFRSVCVALTVLSFAGCGTLDVNAPAVPDAATTDIELADAAVLLDQVAGLSEVVVEPDRLVLWLDSSEVEVDLGVGSVVVGGRGGGYLREVTGVQRDGARVILATVEADLSQVIERGAWEMELRAEALRSFEHSFGEQWDFGGRVLVDESLWSDAEGGYVNVSMHVADGAFVKLDPIFRAKGEVLGGSWLDAGFQLEGTLDTSADFVIATSGKITSDVEQKVFEGEVEINQTIGVVPVRGTARIEVVAGVSGRFDANVSTTLHTEAHGAVHMGAGYTDGWWGSAGCGTAPEWGVSGDSSTGDCFTWDVSDRDSSANLDAHARAWVRVDMTIELYSSAGANLKLEPWADLSTCNDSDGAAPIGIDLDAGLKGEHGYHFRAFGWDWLSNDWGPYPFDAGTWDLYPGEPMTCGALLPGE